MKLTEGQTYIFKSNTAYNLNSFTKHKIVEITKTTYLIKNMDSDIEFRIGIYDFNNDYTAIEEVKEKKCKHGIWVEIENTDIVQRCLDCKIIRIDVKISEGVTKSYYYKPTL